MGKIVGLIVREKQYVCPHCGKEYKSQAALDRHIQADHAPQ